MKSSNLVPTLLKFLHFAYGACVMRWLAFRHRALLGELRPLATRLEQEIASRRKAEGAYFNVISLTDGRLELNDNADDSTLVASCSELAAAMQRTGLSRIELDVQLEEGQVAEALLLFLHGERHLASPEVSDEEYTGWAGRGIARQMLTDQGFHKFCFLLHVDPDDGIFRATYSYCELPLSIFVQRYVQNHAKYGDHRVLFKAAPRIALVVFAVVLAPVFLYFWLPGLAILVFGILGTAAALAAGVTLYTLGSIQYTREHHDTMMKRYVEQIEKLSRFPEANPNMVMELSAEGTALYLNPSAKKLLAELNLDASALERLLTPGYRDVVRDSLESPGRTFRDEAECEGRTFSFQYVSFAGGESVILAGVEVTYLKQIEGDLRAAHTISEAQRDEIAEAYRLLDEEFKIIGDIQRALLPREIPQLPGLEIATHYETCQRAGGDYYDFFPLRNGCLGILIADVSGHGSPAAVLMAITHTIAHILHEDAEALPPHETIAHLNRTLARHYQHRGDFVTAIYGIYDPERRVLSYSSAGHNPPALRNHHGGETCYLPKQSGIPLGILEEAAYETSEVELSGGNTVVLYTDGITEAMDASKNLFGEDRMAAAVGNGAAAREQVGRLLAEVRAFVGEEPLNDDRTVVLIQSVPGR